MHSLYFISYALVGAFSLIIMVWAQYIRNRREGTPYNITAIKVVTGFTLAMLIGAVLTEFAYDSENHLLIGLAAFTLGSAFAAYIAWQVNVVVQTIQSDKRALLELSTLDALTGLGNRRIFHETVAGEAARSNEFGLQLSLIFVDIDNLSHINEVHGYKGGDIVLFTLGRKLVEWSRDYDTICRYDDDDMALILPQTELATAQRLADRFVKNISETLIDLENGHVINVTVSIGIAHYAPPIDNDRKLIDAAIGAANVAKGRGGNRTFLFDKEMGYIPSVAPEMEETGKRNAAKATEEAMS